MMFLVEPLHIHIMQQLLGVQVTIQMLLMNILLLIIL